MTKVKLLKLKELKKSELKRLERIALAFDLTLEAYLFYVNEINSIKKSRRKHKF